MSIHDEEPSETGEQTVVCFRFNNRKVSISLASNTKLENILDTLLAVRRRVKSYQRSTLSVRTVEHFIVNKSQGSSFPDFQDYRGKEFIREEVYALLPRYLEREGIEKARDAFSTRYPVAIWGNILPLSGIVRIMYNESQASLKDLK